MTHPSVPTRDTKHKHFAAPGACIYCGATGDLTDEHIIPFSLAGIMIFRDASCRACAKITHAFEYTCGRRVFGDFRMRHKLPTRRKKDRPTHIAIGTKLPDGQKGVAAIPVEEYPAPTMVYAFGQANLLAGFRPGTGIFKWEALIISSHEEMTAAQKKYNWDTITKLTALPKEYARMLAKIAHSFAVAHLGLDSFRPLAVDVILGESHDFGDVVGGSLDVPPHVPDAGHLLVLHWYIAHTRFFIVVEIRLFASIGTPTYHVVVGEVHGQENIAAFVQKHGEGQPIEFPNALG